MLPDCHGVTLCVVTHKRSFGPVCVYYNKDYMEMAIARAKTFYFEKYIYNQPFLVQP